MNDLARETLIEAELKGVRQIRKKLADRDGGLCAMGVLARKFEEAGGDILLNDGEFHQYFGLSSQEVITIVRANDVFGWSFLDIARKVGIPEESTT